VVVVEFFRSFQCRLASKTRRVARFHKGWRVLRWRLPTKEWGVSSSNVLAKHVVLTCAATNSQIRALPSKGPFSVSALVHHRAWKRLAGQFTFAKTSLKPRRPRRIPQGGGDHVHETRIGARLIMRLYERLLRSRPPSITKVTGSRAPSPQVGKYCREGEMIGQG